MSLMMMLIVYIAMFGVHDSGYLYSTGMKEKRMDNDNKQANQKAAFRHQTENNNSEKQKAAFQNNGKQQLES